jgi:hypothetical protein
MSFDVGGVIITSFDDFPMANLINLAGDALFNRLAPEARG